MAMAVKFFATSGQSYFFAGLLCLFILQQKVVDIKFFKD